MGPQQVIDALQAMATPEKAEASAWFFKTGPGQYGEGDRFLGVTVPEQRKIAKRFHELVNSRDITALLHSPWHECRLTALLMIVMIFRKGDENTRRDMFDLYMDNTDRVNNWDLVDSSASYIVGAWLEDNPYKMNVLTKLANSDMLWERRIAMIATLYYIAKGNADEALQIADVLITDRHDLIQKAVGWMLREVGKRCGRQYLYTFLDNHAATMPRTALGYAIEHLPPEERRHYMQLKSAT